MALNRLLKNTRLSQLARCAASLVKSTCFHVCLIPRFLRALHPDIFEQPVKIEFFNKLLKPLNGVSAFSGEHQVANEKIKHFSI
jgi:hypothetical protein